jgi:type I restriction enzyme S subunit
MVNAQQDYETTYLQEIKHITIPIPEIFESKGNRIDASVYCTAGRTTRQLIQQYGGDSKPLAGTNGFVTAYHRPRFKRVFVKKSNLPIYQPSQICDVYPKPELFISDKTDTKIEQLRIHKGQILVTCSGTIGKISFVGDTLDNKIFSHDLLRLNPVDSNDAGYIYAFLSSKYGQALLTTNNYGAVVQHIEPSHLTGIKIPNPPKNIKVKISKLIFDSFKLRDESNALIDKAQQTLIQELKLLPLYELPQKVFGDNTDVTTYTIPASKLNSRLDGSYHVPIVDAIVNHISKHAVSVVTVSDKKISKDVILPGRFKRVYVEEDNGIPFFGGKQIYELVPSNTKYLSKVHHSKRVKEQLELKENMILITCSGTIGKVAIVPKHWEGWAANQHILRIAPANNEIAGYVYAWLNTDYGETLIKKHTYGAVVDEIDNRQLSEVPIPLVEEGKQQQINDLVLEANKKRYQAYLLEQEAISLINSQVLN